VVIDPMLATGNTAVAAWNGWLSGVTRLRFVCLVASPGLERLRGWHPDVPIWTPRSTIV
jgi:uracil phosphoribosyltransferase